MKFLCAAFLAELRGELKPLSGQCLFILMFRVLRRCPKTQNVQMSKPGRAWVPAAKAPPWFTMMMCERRMRASHSEDMARNWCWIPERDLSKCCSWPIQIQVSLSIRNMTLFWPMKIDEKVAMVKSAITRIYVFWLPWKNTLSNYTTHSTHFSLHSCSVSNVLSLPLQPP